MDLDLSVIARNARILADGLAVSFQLFLVALAGGLPLGITLGLARLSRRKWVYYPATLYVNVIRNIPLLLVIFWVYFVLPIVVGRPVAPFPAAAAAFIMFEATYFGEIVRAGFQISRGQMLAGYATGMTHLQVVRYILIPIGLRRVIPSLLTQCIVLFQDTSLAYVIGLREFVRTAGVIDGREARSLELYGFVGLVFFVLCFAASQAVQHREAVGRWLRRRRGPDRIGTWSSASRG